MPLEPLAEVRVLNLGDELRQDLAGQLLLDVEDVAELVQEEIPRCGDIWHVPLSDRMNFDLRYPPPARANGFSAGGNEHAVGSLWSAA